MRFYEMPGLDMLLFVENGGVMYTWSTNPSDSSGLNRVGNCCNGDFDSFVKCIGQEGKKIEELDEVTDPGESDYFILHMTGSSKFLDEDAKFEITVFQTGDHYDEIVEFTPVNYRSQTKIKSFYRWPTIGNVEEDCREVYLDTYKLATGKRYVGMPKIEFECTFRFY